MTMSAQERAERSAAAMWQSDEASKGMGLELISVAPGQAEMRMRVEQRHLNGHQICHGGYIFSLADSCFAFACNSYNQNVVAQHNTISFLAPGRMDDILTARATEAYRAGRDGIYDITVTNQTGDRIAHFQGKSRVIRGQHFDEEEK